MTNHYEAMIFTKDYLDRIETSNMTRYGQCNDAQIIAIVVEVETQLFILQSCEQRI